MLPRPRILVDCWDTVVRELDRVAPAEGILLPLLALRRRDARANPCSAIRLEDLEEVVIADVVQVPPERQLNGAVRVAVLPETDQVVHAEVQQRLSRHPRLRACGYLHSHPFAYGRTWPSSGDHGGHMIPLQRHNRDCGLETCFSFIACRSSAPEGWRLQAFALDEQARVVDLGTTLLLGNSQEARRLLRPAADPVVQGCVMTLRELGLQVRVDELFDGWTRVVAPLDGTRTAVALLPLDFPDVEAQVYVVDGGGTRQVGTDWHTLQEVLHVTP